MADRCTLSFGYPILPVLLLSSHLLNINGGRIFSHHPQIVPKHHYGEEEKDDANKGCNAHGQLQKASLLNHVALFCPPFGPCRPTLFIKVTVKVDYAAADGRERTTDHHIKVEQNEGFHVAEADAVIHPGAVVVHGQYALLADGAVVGARWLHTLTLVAHLLHVEDLVSR